MSVNFMYIFFLQKTPTRTKGKKCGKNGPNTQKPPKLSKELWDLLQMADNFILVENMRAKNSGKCCGDQKEIFINHKLRASPEHMNLLINRQH